MALLHGMAFGALFVFTFGPTFFTILQSSLNRGFLAGALVALGISLCDITYATLAVLGMSQLIDNVEFKWWLALGGGIVLFLLGVASFFKKPKIQNMNEASDKSGLYRFFIKGVLINGVNPFVIIFWMGMVGMTSVQWGYEGVDRNFFIAGMLTMILTTDLIKSFLANRLRKWITVKRIILLQKIIGIALVAFSMQLFWEVLK